jgi:hypothetical protein
MAIATEFINFIVPIKIIEEKYPGGWAQCLKDHSNLIGGRVWFDDYLFRDGAMNPMSMRMLVEEWSSLGFDCIGEKNGKKYWKDVCVYEGMFGKTTLACEWLEVDLKTGNVALKDAPSCYVGQPESLLVQKK